MTYQYVRNRLAIWPLNVRLATKIKVCSVNSFRIDSLHCRTYMLKRKERKPIKTSGVQANSKVTYWIRLIRFQFLHLKISRPWNTVLSGFGGSLSFFVPLPSHAFSHAGGHLSVSRAFGSTGWEKRETARSTSQ